MADQAAHVDQARHNKDVVKKIEKLLDTEDWQITMIFYIAVQYLDSYLATFGKHPLNHANRRNLLNPHTLIGSKFSKTFLDSYERLYNASRSARYIPGWYKKVDCKEFASYLTDLNVIRAGPK